MATSKTRAAPIPTFRPGIHHADPDFFFFAALTAAAAAALASFGVVGLGIVFISVPNQIPEIFFYAFEEETDAAKICFEI